MAVIITTMCALINNNDEVLFIDRHKSWTGLAFPGGHLKEGESLHECVKREILEETGYRIENIEFKGIAHFYNSVSKERYIVFNYSTSTFSGVMKQECSEGKLYWIPISKLDKHIFAEGMEYRFDLFLSLEKTEMYVEWDEVNGYKVVEKY